MNLINEALRMARLKARIKQQDLAKQLGLPSAFLSEIENGHAKLPQRCYPLLPDEIRPAVIYAVIRELYDQADELRKLLK
jgi:transcriptional regulator with XRE-family HTH domain